MILIAGFYITEGGACERRQNQHQKSMPPFWVTWLLSPESPIAKRAARAPRRCANAYCGCTHLRYLQSTVPCPQDVAILVQWLPGHQRFQHPTHTVNIPYHLLQFWRQSTVVRILVEKFSERYERASVLQFSRKEEKWKLNTIESGCRDWLTAKFDAFDACQLQHDYHGSTRSRIMRSTSSQVSLQGREYRYFLINGEHGRSDWQ